MRTMPRSTPVSPSTEAALSNCSIKCSTTYTQCEREILLSAAGNEYVAIVDRYSGYAWAERLSSTTSRHVLSVLESWFKELGWQLFQLSDNRPKFRSEFSLFCSASNPYNPESNELAKVAVKNMKSLVLRCKARGGNLCHAIASWRNMVRQDRLSPTQMFFVRHQQLGLPMLPELLNQSHVDMLPYDMLQLTHTASRYSNTAVLSNFVLGDRVWM